MAKSVKNLVTQNEWVIGKQQGHIFCHRVKKNTETEGSRVGVIGLPNRWHTDSVGMTHLVFHLVHHVGWELWFGFGTGRNVQKLLN